MRLKKFVPFLVMGFTSMLLQITVLRLLLSTFSGNELDIGITLSFWLVYAGIGSFLGKKIKLKQAFALSFIFLSLLAEPTVLAIKAIRPLLSLGPGETVSLTSTIFSTAIILCPLCLIIGLQFPLAVSYSGGREAAGRVYGVEAFGALAGGVLFTFLISSRMGALELCLFLSLINILLAAGLWDRKSVVAIFVIPMMFYLGFYKVADYLLWHGVKLSETAESKYGEIAVIKVGGQSSVYAGGHLIFSYPDLQSEETKTHFAMTLHPSPRRILVIGGSPGVLKEFLKYPVEVVDFIEPDPKIIEISRKLFEKEADREALKDQRIRIITEDGRKFVKEVKEPAYDLIVLNLPQPSTAGISRFYTVEFFCEAKKALKSGGMLAISISQSTGYMGRMMRTANAAIFNSLGAVFRHVEVTSQEYAGLFASDSPIEADPLILEERFIQRAISAKYFTPYIFRDAFSPLNVGYVKGRLAETKVFNRDLQPSAYLYNLMLWAEMHGGKALQHLIGLRRSRVLLIVFIIFVLALPFTFRKKEPSLYCSVLTTGISGMAFMLSGILAYQALYGYVYEMIGILSATFMAGLWIGAMLTKRVRRALKTLFYMELAAIVLAIAAPLFFNAEILFYGLIFLSGILTGSLFGTANLAMPDSGEAGRLYGMDLMGSFLGAIIPSIIIIPLFGISQTLLLVAFLKAFSAAMLLSALNRKT